MEWSSWPASGWGKGRLEKVFVRRPEECALCGSTEDVARRDCRVCFKMLAILCERCHLGVGWKDLRGWLNRAGVLMDLHGCRNQVCDRKHDKRRDCPSEECYAYPATIERESTVLRGMGKGLDGLGWGLLRETDEYNREGQREYMRKIDEQNARVEEQEKYVRRLENEAAESDGT